MEYSKLRSQTVKDFANFPLIFLRREMMYTQALKTLHVVIVKSHDVTSLY